VKSLHCRTIEGAYGGNIPSFRECKAGMRMVDSTREQIVSMLPRLESRLLAFSELLAPVARDASLRKNRRLS
jgi:hypothetical protein